MAERSPFHPYNLAAAVVAAGLWTLIAPGIGLVGGALVGFVAHLDPWLSVAIGIGVMLIAVPVIAAVYRKGHQAAPDIGSYYAAGRALEDQQMLAKIAPTGSPPVSTLGAQITVTKEQAAGAILNAPKLKTASLRLGGELREIRRQVERVKNRTPMDYPRNFRLPTDCWEEYESFLAEAAPHTYEVVARAYEAARRVQIAYDDRKAPLGRSRDRPAVLVKQSDGLDEARRLAGEALDAFGEAH